MMIGLYAVDGLALGDIDGNCVVVGVADVGCAIHLSTHVSLIVTICF